MNFMNQNQDLTFDDCIIFDLIMCFNIRQYFISIFNHKHLFSRWPCNVHRFVYFEYKYLFVCLIHVNHAHTILGYKYLIMGVEMTIHLLTKWNFCENQV